MFELEKHKKRLELLAEKAERYLSTPSKDTVTKRLALNDLWVEISYAKEVLK
jgi:hypothetical protein